MELKNFTENDYDGFAGAEAFTNGDAPLIGYSSELIVIVDINGVTLWRGEEQSECYQLEIRNAKAASLAVVNALNLVSGDLKSYGFEEL